MRRLLPLLVVGFLLVGVGATPALADHRTDNLVFDSSGDLTGSAKGVLRGGVFLPINGYSSWFLTQSVTINGTAVPAGTQLTTAQATAVMAQPGGLSAVAQNASTSGAPSGAISPSRQTAATSVVERARRAGRVLPSIRKVGVLPLVAAGTALPSYVTAWKMQIPGQTDLYRLLSLSEHWTATEGTPASNKRWFCIETSPAAPCSGLPGTLPPAITTQGWRFRSNEADTCFWTTDLDGTPAIGDWQLGPPTTGAPYGSASGPQKDTCHAAMSFAATAIWVQTQISSGGVPQYAIFRTDEMMDERVNSEPADANTFNTWGGTTVTTNYNQPTYDSDDDDAMRDTINPGSQSQADQDAEDAVAKAINPAADPGLDPTTGTPNPVPIVPPTTTIPSTPALDFTPLTDVDFGCKFPYGFLCYAVDVTEIFDVAPDAPRFVFDIPTVNVGITEFGGGEDGWVVDLEVMDDWAAIWRGIWSVVIVIGAVYLVATRLLGFKAGGDPGAAMDDAL